jgi:hypothetical protein
MNPQGRCLFCGGVLTGPDHWLQCDGRQGALEAREHTACTDPACVICPVLDAARAHRVTEQAVARSTEHAPTDISEQARQAVTAVAQRQDTLTSDDVWSEMGRDVMREWNPSALGGVFRSLARDGVILLTDERRESQRPAHHRKPLRVWRSLIYREAS